MSKIFNVIKNQAKDAILGKPKIYKTQLASFDYSQLELEYVYKKAGNLDDVIVTDTVTITHEKDNKYDPNALAIYAFNVKIGYVPMSEQSNISKIKKKDKVSVRLYFFNNKYRAELIINYRD